MHDAHGVGRWPTQMFELVFQLVVGVTFMALVKRRVFHGRLFSLYLVLYGLFRFATEFLRDTPKWFAPLSLYQLLSLAMALIGGAMFAWRTRHPAPNASELPPRASDVEPSPELQA